MGNRLAGEISIMTGSGHGAGRARGPALCHPAGVTHSSQVDSLYPTPPLVLPDR